MANFVHKTPYRFYIQKYPDGETQFPVVDIEELFKCRFVSMTNTGGSKVKNTYAESFAEADGDNLWIPSSDGIAYDASDITLTLRWRSDECDDVMEWSEKFIAYISGRKFEWHDTFRPGRYIQFTFTEEPSVKDERLYGSLKYRFIEFKLRNFGGRFYKNSKFS